MPCSPRACSRSTRATSRVRWPLLREALTLLRGCQPAAQPRLGADLVRSGRAGRHGTQVDGRTPEEWFAQALEEFTAPGRPCGRRMGPHASSPAARCAPVDLDLAHDRARSRARPRRARASTRSRPQLGAAGHDRARPRRRGPADELIARATSGHEDSGDRWHQAVALATAAGMATGRHDLDRAAGSLLDAMEIVDELPEDEATVNVLVAAFDFLAHVGRASDVAPIVGGLASRGLHAARAGGPHPASGAPARRLRHPANRTNRPALAPPRRHHDLEDHGHLVRGASPSLNRGGATPRCSRTRRGRRRRARGGSRGQGMNVTKPDPAQGTVIVVGIGLGDP